MDFTYNNQPCIIEVTIISAQGVKNSSSIFSDRLRAFATASTTPKLSWASSNNSGGQNVHDDKLYMTNVDYKGGVNPTWGYKFQLNLDGTFFSNGHSSLHINLYSKDVLWWHTHIGWCAIPSADIVGGMMPAGSLGHLSYRLRERDGTWGHGVVNVGVKLLQGSIMLATPPRRPLMSHLPGMDLGKVVVGVPVAMGSSEAPGTQVK